MPVAAIGFDIDHTLAVDNALERVAFLRLLAHIDRDGGRLLGTLDEESRAIDDLLHRQRAGACTIDEAVYGFVRERGIENAQSFAQEFRETALSLVDDIVVPLPGVERLVGALDKAGIATAVLSNGWSPLQERKARRAGFPGRVLASDDIGAAKPSAAAFAALVRALGTAAYDTWYVGDDPRNDMQGAREAGLRCAWFNACGDRYPADLAPPDARVASLEEILALVREPAVR
ncbi:MAG: HAD family hydrolase [Candidatus Tyrphobacter sp.]